MKCRYVIMNLGLILLIASSSIAQNENLLFIPSVELNITDNKTTNLIFPYAVQSIDRGSEDILVQQPKAVENIVQVKAGRADFNQTNLSIITVDGKLYSFTVNYSLQPSQLNIVIRKAPRDSNSIYKQTVQLTAVTNEALFQWVAQKITGTKVKHIKHDRTNQMELQLNGIYINRDVLYFRLELKNKSNIGYDIDHIKFSIKDRQKARRTATQETELTPIYQFGDLKNVRANLSSSGIVALPKFTLPDAKYLLIRVSERNGGRALNLVLNSRQVMKAAVIKEEELNNY